MQMLLDVDRIPFSSHAVGYFDYLASMSTDISYSHIKIRW